MGGRDYMNKRFMHIYKGEQGRGVIHVVLNRLWLTFSSSLLLVPSLILDILSKSLLFNANKSSKLSHNSYTASYKLLFNSNPLSTNQVSNSSFIVINLSSSSSLYVVVFLCVIFLVKHYLKYIGE